MIDSVTTLILLLLASAELNCILLYLMLDYKEAYKACTHQAYVSSQVDADTIGFSSTSPKDDTGSDPEKMDPNEVRVPDVDISMDPGAEHGNEPEEESVPEPGLELTDANDPRDMDNSHGEAENGPGHNDDDEEKGESPFSEYFRKLREDLEKNDPERFEIVKRLLQEMKAMIREPKEEQGVPQTDVKGSEKDLKQPVESSREPKDGSAERQNECGQTDLPEQTPEPEHQGQEQSDKNDVTDQVSRIRTYTRMHAGPFMIQGMSIQGRGHLTQNKPCQDFHYVDTVGEEFVIAVVSDGAGSKKNSAYGSSIVCEKTAQYLKEAVRSLKWGKGNLPDSKTWDEVFRKIVQLVQGELGRYSKEEGRAFDSLAATLIVLLVSNEKTYYAHVGDGRAGVLTPDGWKAVMTPHTGAESNQTVFMTNRVLDPGLVISGVSVPETGVIGEPVSAFVLMSDGLENGFWIKNKKEILPDGDFRYRKMNIPFEPALNDVIERMSKCEEGQERTLFFSILDHYNVPLRDETDDKTLCLAYTYPSIDNNGEK